MVVEIPTAQCGNFSGNRMCIINTRLVANNSVVNKKSHTIFCSFRAAKSRMYCFCYADNFDFQNAA